MTIKDRLAAAVDARRDAARKLVQLIVVLAVAVAIIGLLGYHMETSGLKF